MNLESWNQHLEVFQAIGNTRFTVQLFPKYKIVLTAQVHKCNIFSNHFTHFLHFRHPRLGFRLRLYNVSCVSRAPFDRLTSLVLNSRSGWFGHSPCPTDQLDPSPYIMGRLFVFYHGLYLHVQKLAIMPVTEICSASSTCRRKGRSSNLFHQLDAVQGCSRQQFWALFFCRTDTGAFCQTASSGQRLPSPGDFGSRQFGNWP